MMRSKRESDQQYYQAHTEAIQQRTAAYYAAHQADISEATKQRRLTDPAWREKIAARKRKARQLHPEAHKEADRRKYLKAREQIIARVSARSKARTAARRAQLGLLPLHDPSIPPGMQQCVGCTTIKAEGEFRWKDKAKKTRESRCKACRKLYYAKRYQEQATEILAQQRANYDQHKNEADFKARNSLRARRSRQKHRTKVIARERAYRQANGDHVRQLARERYRQDPVKYIGKMHRRRAKIMGTDATLTATQWRALKAIYGGRCAYCRKPSQRLTQDHVVPLSKGGRHTVENVVPACLSCNVRKYTNKAPTFQPMIQGLLD